MVWFNYLQSNSIINTVPSTPNYLAAPLKRQITFGDVKDTINANDWLFVKNNGQSINKMYKRDLSIEEQDHSYLVVCENETNQYDATPASTIISGDLIFFKSPKSHATGSVINYKYNLYYGKNYLKYIQATPAYMQDISGYTTVYIQNSQATINYYLTGSNSQNYAPYSAASSSINYYQYIINSSSSGKYLMTYFNQGTDWVNNVSQKAGSKVTANFDGPNVAVYGTVGPEYGKLKYRIIQKEQNAEKVVVDWTIVDCYSLSSDSKNIIEITSLDYYEYVIEIETLSEKNSLATSNKIKIDQLKFLRNFNLTLGEEEINSNLSFISIGGLR